MATKANFTPDEWKTLLQSPLIVGIAVSAADPSGLFGLLKESMASARALLQAEADPNADELVKAVAADFETSEGRGAAQEGVKALLAGAKPADALRGSRRFSPPRPPPTLSPTRPGSRASGKRSRKQPPRVASSASAARRSATPKRRRWPRSRRRWGFSRENLTLISIGRLGTADGERRSLGPPSATKSASATAI
jgi:hypothetical protein